MAQSRGTGKSVIEGLVMRHPTSVDDIYAVAQLNGQVFGPEIEHMTIHLMTKHPHIDWEDMVFVEDGNGKVVSSLVYVPTRWHYGCASLEVAEMTLVATLASHRRQGLVRRQIAYYEQRMTDRGAVLSAIQGIPHFYRQFGYDYALPLAGGWRLAAFDASEVHCEGFVLRPAHKAECKPLARLLQEAQRSLAICVDREDDVWRHLVQNNDPRNAMGRETMVVEDRSGNMVAYFCLPHFHFGQALTVNEASKMSVSVAHRVLHWLVQQAANAQRPGVRLNLPDSSDLVRLSKAYGAYPERRYAWQILIPSRGAFLCAIAPELERRITGTCFENVSRSVVVSFCTDAYRMEFNQGRIEKIDAVDLWTIETDIIMPAQAFLPLAMGTRSLDEVRSLYPDLSARGENLLLLDMLFPKVGSFIYPSY